MRGYFFSIEGGDGGGKSTQAKLIVDYFSSLNCVVRRVREPGGTPIGEEIRRVLLREPKDNSLLVETELLLMNASRAQLTGEIIKPSLERGEIVISERYFDATMAYQGYGRGLNLDMVQNIINVACSGVKPDLTILMDVDPLKGKEKVFLRADGQAVKGERKEDKAHSICVDQFEAADIEFYKRVREGYHELAKKEPERFRIVPYLENQIGETHKLIRVHIDQFIKNNPREFLKIAK